jgi:NAD(P)-dependent dehydrogenase (short-subunit alcohol dehydrogenase family)
VTAAVDAVRGEFGRLDVLVDNAGIGRMDGARRPLTPPSGGALVRDAVAADPEAFLGPSHVARFGDDPPPAPGSSTSERR